MLCVVLLTAMDGLVQILPQLFFKHLKKKQFVKFTAAVKVTINVNRISAFGKYGLASGSQPGVHVPLGVYLPI